MVLYGHDKRGEKQSEKAMAFESNHQIGWRTIGYQFLLGRLQAMWRTQHDFACIDLCNDFFIARFSNKQDYDVALFNSPWVFSDHYLHEPWVPNFMPKTTKIESLLVRVRFPVISVEYYTSKWLERAGNKIGKTNKLDRTTLMASRGKFVRICVRDRLNQILEGRI